MQKTITNLKYPFVYFVTIVYNFGIVIVYSLNTFVTKVIDFLLFAIYLANLAIFVAHFGSPNSCSCLINSSEYFCKSPSIATAINSFGLLNA